MIHVLLSTGERSATIAKLVNGRACQSGNFQFTQVSFIRILAQIRAHISNNESLVWY